MFDMIIRADVQAERRKIEQRNESFTDVRLTWVAQEQVRGVRARSARISLSHSLSLVSLTQPITSTGTFRSHGRSVRI